MVGESSEDALANVPQDALASLQAAMKHLSLNDITGAVSRLGVGSVI